MLVLPLFTVPMPVLVEGLMALVLVLLCSVAYGLTNVFQKKNEF
jgi:hypothetical protein